MAKPPSAEREFAERMALFFETLGGTRTMGAIYGWLTVCVPSHQSITEMADALGVSKASISTIVRQLELAQMVERVPMPGSRQHHYQIRSGGWMEIMRARVARMSPAVVAADDLMAKLGTDDVNRLERVQEMRDFFNFVEYEYGHLLAERWEEFRRRAHAERAATRDA